VGRGRRGNFCFCRLRCVHKLSRCTTPAYHAHPPAPARFMDTLLAAVTLSGGDPVDLTVALQACGLVSPTLHGYLLDYPCVYLFDAENGCVAARPELDSTNA